MTELDYECLLTQLGQHLGLPHAQTLHQTGLLRVGEHDLLLRYHTAHAPHTLLARLEVGVAPQEQQEWLWYRLLISNFEWSSYGLLGWSLTPEGDHVVLTVPYRMDPLPSGAELARWLGKLIACAQAYWHALPAPQPVADLQALVPLQRLAWRQPSQPLTEPVRGEQLIEALCNQVGLAAEETGRSEGCSLAVEGIDMLLRYDNAFPERIEVCIDLGRDIDLPREKLWQGLLQDNFLVGSAGRVLFSVHPEREAVMLALQHDIAIDTNAAEMADWLRTLAGNAHTFWVDARTKLTGAEAARQGHRFC